MNLYLAAKHAKNANKFFSINIKLFAIFAIFALFAANDFWVIVTFIYGKY